MTADLEQLLQRHERAKREASFLLSEKRELDRRYTEAMRREQESAAALDAFLSDTSLVGLAGYSGSKQESHDGKAGFISPAAALVACVEMKSKRLWDLWPYKCRFCAYYHIGNMPMQVKRMAQLLAA